jgi:hypothetical protein
MAEWTIEISGPIAADLEASLYQGPMLNDAGLRRLDEKTIDRVLGLKIQVFADEHPPPHFRVIFEGESNNFTIRDCLALNGNALARYFKNIRAWHRVNKPRLIAAWNANRPTGCPVGLYRE